LANAAGALTSNENNSALNWYCNKTKNGEQPKLPTEFSFISECEGYYIDKNAPERNDKVIYLTFDCGYENGNVAKILDVLKAHNAKGAFFVLGNLVRRNTELVKRMNKEGHLVCNHTCSHKNMTKISDKDAFEKELKALDDLTTELCGFSAAPYYRPPEGCFNKQNLIWAKDLGYKTVFWSCAYDDWDNNRQMSSEKAMEKLMSRLHNGEVLLLHPTSKTNADILDGFLNELEKQGYRFGTLDELTSEN
jgi:peptidoglycan-N-acetylmuramic acid deacetylase